ncbi:MAG: nucleoside-diphosphate sugar epimerase/dehydratase [Pseudomonadota bacterium]
MPNVTGSKTGPKLGFLYRIAVAMTRQQKRSIILTVDVLLIFAAYLAARALVIMDGSAWADTMTILYDALALIASGMIATVLLGLHKIKLNAYQMQGVVGSAFVAGVLLAVGLVMRVIPASVSTPAEVFVITAMMFLITSVSSRLLMRRALLYVYAKGTPRMPILIYGAGQTGQQLATALLTDDQVDPAAFVDDDPKLRGLTVAGLRVHPSSDLEALIEKHAIKRVIIAMPSVPRSRRTFISRQITQTGVEVHALPSFSDMVTQSDRDLAKTQPVNIDLLLGRERLEEELPGVADTYEGKHILITGAGGSIGSEICRQLLPCNPASLTVMDHSELALFEIDRELREMPGDARIHAVLGSVTDQPLVEATMKERGINIVLHAAAYKHVPLVQHNALEGIKNNVLGTKCVADAARAVGAERFILVSTDKAVRPSSVMGASKRFAELLVQDLATRSKDTRFSMVRFGNVLNSSGSVIPLFHEQISRGGPVTLTHADVTRFFMTISEAVRLVLLAGSFARGGDVFVLDMGQPVAVRDLARKMIEISGHTVRDADNPDGDIEIKVTGLRPGEKLHEELLIGSDMLTTPHPKIMRAQEKHLSEIEMAKALQALRTAIDDRNPEHLHQILDQWIETNGKDKIKIVNE